MCKPHEVCFHHFLELYAQQPHKMDKITSVEDDKRKFLMKKFLSLGTNLGSMGSLSQKALPEIFSNVVFLHPWDPNGALMNPICPSHAKSLDLFPT